MRIAGIERGALLTVSIDGAPVPGHDGETVATVMLAAGLTFRTDTRGAPRGLWCNMGSCGECTVAIDGIRQRACLVAARDGMTVTTRHG
ncbi:(2Fe-2S)-binding protein [Polymorphobacter sp.]|uniref:(2Fe-2S)-binding protein n=1 Tax=Polymorphobacter sp. TaxID=1909290 RepID=UPI003F72B974